jgi:hypothetical protein
MDVLKSAGSVEPGSLSSYGRLSEGLSGEAKDFSLIAGGPLYQFLLRVKLVRPPLDRVGWRIVVITMIVWAPLLLLTALGGRVMSGIQIPFLRDFEAQSRLLVGLPLLIAAELTVHQDIQSLAGLANSYNVVQSIVPFPFGKENLVALVVLIALPLVPLLLTMFSAQELVERILKVLF